MFRHFGVCLHYDSCYIEHVSLHYSSLWFYTLFKKLLLALQNSHYAPFSRIYFKFLILLVLSYFLLWHAFLKRLEDEPSNNYFGMKYLVPEYLNAVWELIRSLAMGYTHGPEYREGWLSIFVRVTGLLFPGTSAHSLTDYINSVKLGKGHFVRMSKTHEVGSFERGQPWIIWWYGL